MHVTCDEFYILSKFKVIKSEAKVIEGHGCRGGIVLREHILFPLFSLKAIITCPPKLNTDNGGTDGQTDRQTGGQMEAETGG